MALIALVVGAAVVVVVLATLNRGPRSLRSARIGPPLLNLVKVGTFDQPVYVTAPPGDRRHLFIVERTGRIRVMRDKRLLGTPFLDLSAVVNYSGTEDGFLSMAFAPDYGKTGRFYVDYTGKDNHIRVLEYRRLTPQRADPTTRRLVLLLRKPSKGNQRKAKRQHFDTHNGGLLLFGGDRLLYISVGDGGTAYDRYNHAQNLGSLLGKILRIDPRPNGGRPYRVPPNNPFVHRRGARPEVYDYGLRNPWRFALDPVTGAMAIADVGKASQEEIDFEPAAKVAGRNYGWRVFEGFKKAGHPVTDGNEERAAASDKAPNAVFPVIAYKHPVKPCASVTGGVFVHDPTLRPYAGRYLWGDYCSGRIYSTTLGSHAHSSNVAATTRAAPTLTSFGEDAQDRIYVCTQGGDVYRLVLNGLE